MMPTTTGDGLRFPVLEDDANVPEDLANLANDTQTALNRRIPATGGTITGNLTVPTPTVSGQAANKTYVDSRITYGTAAPPVLPVGVIYCKHA